MAFRLRLPGAVVVLLLVAASSAPGQTARIKGVVTDGSRPLDNATVEIFGRKGSQLTPASGAFSFDSLAPGPYWLRVRRIGHHPLTFATSLMTGETKEFEVELQAADWTSAPATVPRRSHGTAPPPGRGTACSTTTSTMSRPSRSTGAPMSRSSTREPSRRDAAW